MPNTVLSRFAATVLLAVAIAGSLGSSSIATAQQPCGQYLGIICTGALTDEGGRVTAPDTMTEMIDRVAARHGIDLRVVIVDNARGHDPATFAATIGEVWGVGDDAAQNGVVLLIALEEGRTELAAQTGMAIDGSAVADVGRPFLAADDIDGGLLAMVGAISDGLAQPAVNPEPSGSLRNVLILGLALLGMVMVAAFVATEQRKRRVVRRSRLRMARRRRSGRQMGPEHESS